MTDSEGASVWSCVHDPRLQWETPPLAVMTIRCKLGMAAPLGRAGSLVTFQTGKVFLESRMLHGVAPHQRG